jgi:hypothetical protein
MRVLASVRRRSRSTCSDIHLITSRFHFSSMSRLSPDSPKNRCSGQAAQINKHNATGVNSKMPNRYSFEEA